MLQRLVKTGEIEVDGCTYVVRYFVQRTTRGARRYSCELLIELADRIILDDDSLAGVESKVARLVPATIHSRLLAGRPAHVHRRRGGAGAHT